MDALARSTDSQKAPRIRPVGVSALTPAAWLLSSIGATLLVSAGLEFRHLRDSPWITVATADAAITIEGDLVYGRLRQGLPERRLHWDGEPPRAMLVDAGGASVIAPPLLLESSLPLNRRGVLWTPDECRFVVERSAWAESGASLRLRCEAVRSSTRFYFYCGLALIAFLSAVLCGQIRRVVQCEAGRRRMALAAELRTSCFVTLSLYTATAFYPGLSFMATADATNINAFAAGRQAPEIMRPDPMLGDARNFAWYTPAYVEFVRWWRAAGFHYGVGTAFLALACTLLGLFGYERLFRAASGSAAFAWLAAVGLWFMKAHYPPYEDWNIVLVLPRTVFSGLLPWAVLAAVAVRARPAWWSLATVATAALFYVHPVSSPALTGAVLLGLVAAGEGPRLKRWAWGCAAGCAALLVMLPYTLTYAEKYAGTVDYDSELMAQATAVARERFAPGFLDLEIFARDLALFVALRPQCWIGLACAAWLVGARRREWPVRLGIGMAAGYAIVALVIPAVDLGLAELWGRLPFQIDLVRNVRYLDVFILSAGGLTLRYAAGSSAGVAAAVRSRLKQFQILPACRALRGAEFQAALAILLALYLGSAIGRFERLGESIVENVRLLTDDPPPHLATRWELVRVLQTVRQPQEVVAGVWGGPSLFLRSAHIPLAWCTKDLGALAYANPRKLVAAKSQIQAAEKQLVWPMTQARMRSVAQSLNAQLIVLNRTIVPSDVQAQPGTLFQNEEFVVVRTEHPSVASAASRGRFINPER